MTGAPGEAELSEAGQAALGYAARGWPVFPCAPGRKTPLTGHGFRDATTDPARIRAWWTARPDANVAIATGHPGPDVVDLDTGADIGAAVAELHAAGLTAGCGDMVRTRSGGMHLYFAGTAQRNGRIPARHVDFRAAGGYVLAPPSQVDADDKPAGAYTRINKAEARASCDWRIIRDILDPPPPPDPFTQPGQASPGTGSTGGGGGIAAMDGSDQPRPGDQFAAVTPWQDILGPAGWQPARTIAGGVRYWRRPGKRSPGISASTRDDGGLWVFSTSTGFEPERCYSKFAAWAVLHGHGSDYHAAAAALAAAGYGRPAGPAPITAAAPAPQAAAGGSQAVLDGVIVAAPGEGTPGASGPAGGADSGPGPDSASGPDESGRTSWYPRDITGILDGDTTADPPPALLARTDGHCLLYRGKINAFIGESESGKTWAALLAVTQALGASAQILYLDFEDSPSGIIARLLSMGAGRDGIAKGFRYIAPDEMLTAVAAADLAEALAGPVPDLIVVDGVNAAMTLLGLNLSDNKDATEFTQKVLNPLKRTGAFVLTVDHVTKDRENRGDYAIGAMSKRAHIDGASYIVEAPQPFGRGQTGRLKLTVAKDRPGHVRAIAAPSPGGGRRAQHAATIVIASDAADGTVTARIDPPDLRTPEEKAADPPFRPTRLMQRVSEYLEACGPGGASRNQAERSVPGKTDYIRQAIDVLQAEGHVRTEPGTRGALLLISVLPYRESDDLTFRANVRDEVGELDSVENTPVKMSGTTSPIPSRPRPDLAPGELPAEEATSPHLAPSPPPYGGGGGRGDGRAAGAPPIPVCTNCGEYHYPSGQEGGRPCFAPDPTPGDAQ